MSLKLTNRLDQIENDIRLMMMLQKCGSLTQTDSMKKLNIDMNSKSMILQRKISCEKTYLSDKSSKSLPPSRGSIEKNPTFIISSPDIIQPPPKFANTPNFNDKLSSSRSFVEDFKAHQKRKYTPLGLELEYEQTRRRILEEEVMKLKIQLSSHLHKGESSISINNQLKIQNDELKSQIEEINGKLSDMTKEKEYLCKCLEREKEKGSSLPKDNETTNNIESDIVNEYKEEIQSLKESLLMLSKKLQEKDSEKQNVVIQKDRLELKLKKQKEKTKRITEINQKLSNSIKIKHESCMALRNKNSKCEKELEQCKFNWVSSQKELEKLKEELETERRQTSKIPKEIMENLNSLKDKEQQSLETIQILTQKFKETEDNSNREAQNEIIYWRNEAECLRLKMEETMKDLERYKQNEDSFLDIKRQHQLCSTNSVILRNKSNELQRIVEEQRRKIEELEFIRQHQDIVINSQNEQLLSKDEQIKLQEQENDIVKEKCLQLDKQLETLRNVLDSKEENQSKNWHKICQLENKIEELKSTLEREKQNVNHQDVLAKAHTNEAEAMRKLTSALEASKRKLEVTIRELDREKENSKVMVNGLEKLTIRKEKLEGMMFSLEGSCNDLLVEKDRYAELCDELQKELAAERSMRLQERTALINERNRAFEVARMAAVTLIDTVDDYEVVTKAQMEAKKSISNLVKNKQKRRPGCPPVPSGKPKSVPNENEKVSENLLNPPDDVIDEISTSDGTDMRYESNCDFNPGIIGTEGVLGIQIPMTALNPYAAVQSTLIPTTPHACWFGNCQYQANQAMCNVSNPYQCASCSNQYPNQHQFGLRMNNSLQRKSSKIRPPIKVASKKSTSSNSIQNKRSR